MAGNQGEYWSCELNLVHEGGRRTRLVGHGDVDPLREEAGRIAEKAGVPLWGAA